ncbi:methyl-accepting chemotaxis protein [Desulfobacula toluolica]|uniref:Putative methyl-accepting chemotaxis sensory transducer n=1 Tax=Desulfobacula toluolica (strain DSM 7467 / Tol2) TaxID=651182 RepID=K0NCF2_DESTT|nr:methyl-accepting chemotaxis protein [Desulfobacula toluolica]CCK78335.1 putative methyl-accepting chemotaxis sensory transducer [Desulfobacula toluolica Tol2]
MNKRVFSLKAKLIMMTLVIVLTVIAIQTAINLQRISKQKEALIHLQGKGYEQFMREINQSSEENMRLALMIANMDFVHQTMKTKDKSGLLNEIKPLNDILNNSNKFNYRIHFHEPGSVSFLRVWKPAKNGDPLAGFRMTVNKVQESKKPVKGIEAGRGGLVVRGLAPILDGGEMIGSVEVFCDISDIAESIDETNAIYGLDKIEATAVQSVQKLGNFNVLKSPPKDMGDVDASFVDQAVKSVMTKEAGNTLLTASPVTDYQDQVVGVYVRFLDIRQINADIRSNIIIMILVAAVLITVSFFFAMLLSNSVANPIKLIIDGLFMSSVQVDSASKQIAAISTALAEGSSDQAASIEETSSSLEEMASMTKNNAKNAMHADNLMQTANQIVTKAYKSMTDLTISMQDITVASKETSKIVKTIDEISFRTNLLALNAAVEAARAGEAGVGFAVVADEVRNLSMRAAEAARNTAILIESTVKKVSDGAELVQSTNHDFNEVAENTKRVGGLLKEIAAASNEQAQGISQVNSAVADMDKVVQQNAASAEQNSGASSEMNVQSLKMKEFVADLSLLIQGDGRSAVTSRHEDTKQLRLYQDTLPGK